jgi:hypothetical protein
MKTTLILILLCLSLEAPGQEKLMNFRNYLKTSSSDIKDVIPVVNETTGEIGFFVADAKNIYGYKIDGNFKITKKLTSEEKSRKYKTLIGNSIFKEDLYRVYLTNSSQDKFASFDFSFKKNTTSFFEFELNTGETFIQTVSHRNQFYLISASELTNELYIYTFDEEGNPKRNKIEIGSLRFISTLGKSTKLTTLLIEKEAIKKFEENTPNSIEITSELRKMYQRENAVLFSFDHHKLFTQVLKIDLNSFEASSFQFKKPFLSKHANRTNSYINGENIFTIAVTKEQIAFEILDFKTGDLIKAYTANKNDSITFKNTAIIQEGGLYDKYRELEKTNRFLKRVATGNTGVSARKIGNQYHLIIGGYIEQKRNPGMMMPFGGIPLGSLGSVTVFFNPAQFAFNSFENNKVTRIESLFDENFNHIKGGIKQNAFDKMKSFTSSNKGGTVFKYKDFYIKTDYQFFKKVFTFRKFMD